MKADSNGKSLMGGIAFTFLLAGLGYLLSLLPGFHLVGQMACAIILAILYRQFYGYPEAIRPGIAFSSKRLLRIAIILYGLKLNIETVLSDGLGLLVRDAGVILFAIGFTVWLAKRLNANPMITLLLGVGTGVCGAAAIAAVAPIVKSKEEDTAISVGIIAMMGTVFAILYTLLRTMLPLDDLHYGMWSGISLHEIAHVVLAAAPGGDDALAIALLAKLGRVFLLVPLCFVLIFMMKRRAAQPDADNAKIEFPWFLLGFILLSVLGSYVFGHSIPVTDTWMNRIFTLTTWILTAAMVGLGLNVSLADLKQKALKPLVAMTCTSALLSVIAYFII